ncbi:MAG: hypothetical protein QM760_16935 [Nibricoccus sp.]
MSDTKWLKTLRALSAVAGEITHLDWKFIDEEQMHRTSVPTPGDLDATRLKDGPFQPFEYREVEWIDVVTKDTTAIRKALASCGKRLVEESTAGVRVVGYRKEPNQPLQRNASTTSVSNFQSPARRG